jgi:hypothetical protein
MTTQGTNIRTANNNEWLEFISFAERALGQSDPVLLSIKQKNITNNGTKSVAAYYKDDPDLGGRATFSRDLSLKQLLKNPNFTSEVLGKSLADVKTWTEIYNNADWTIKTYNNPQDNIYIKCNPVDENNIPIDMQNNSITSDTYSADVLREANDLLAPDKIFQNIGLQIFIGVIFLAFAYLIGNVIFIKYPKTVIEKDQLTNVISGGTGASSSTSASTTKTPLNP